MDRDENVIEWDAECKYVQIVQAVYDENRRIKGAWGKEDWNENKAIWRVD